MKYCIILFFRNILMILICRIVLSLFLCLVRDLEGWELIWRSLILLLFMIRIGIFKWIYRLWYVEFFY